MAFRNDPKDCNVNDFVPENYLYLGKRFGEKHCIPIRITKNFDDIDKSLSFVEHKNTFELQIAEYTNIANRTKTKIRVWRRIA